ncbi:MAG: hypothetical protein EB832_00880 [Thaumarchaeota archaeon S14]|nr:MAG: hypothetical protein EB832_00880 [Thaumarchaeota archaeon S14]
MRTGAASASCAAAHAMASAAARAMASAAARAMAAAALTVASPPVPAKTRSAARGPPRPSRTL